MRLKLAALGFLTVSIVVASANTVQAIPRTIVLVSKTQAIQPSTYYPPDLEIPSGIVIEAAPSEAELAEPAAHALSVMFQAAYQAGLTPVLLSGYRSYASQEVLYRNALQNLGEFQNSVAPPGHSEHQLGLAADIGSFGVFCPAQTCFAFTREAVWFQAHAHSYGFIQRYPLRTELVTGYTYEPWHYRYVGVRLANVLYRSGQTLDEYSEH
ncbi:MAG TPA: M15 family metallopeptidase [Candidatus Microsaccharimonas sp.]|nr:M15 family metallopeptidase [Candidatus Microsaccharimonas sp.]